MEGVLGLFVLFFKLLVCSKGVNVLCSINKVISEYFILLEGITDFTEVCFKI